MSIVTVAEGVVDWYWTYGMSRKDYTIQRAGLATVYDVLARGLAIEKGKQSKPCVAFWGPSQSGKSSMLSHYLDGQEANGADSALSWGGIPARFSSDNTAAGVTVFNPRNGRSDASGLVTRFYLPAEPGAVNQAYPVELVPSSCKQVLLSFAIGYRNECRVGDSVMTTYALKQELDNEQERQRPADKEAFSLLCMLCDVCKILSRCEPGFREWSDLTLCNRLLMSSYATGKERVKKLIADILWNGEQAITDMAWGIIDYTQQWLSGYERVITSVDAAAKLEDIAALMGPTRLYKRNLGNVLAISTTDGDPISADEFGKLQAAIGEMRVPVKQIADNPFYSFLRRCDLLDLPGVTNRATGARDVNDSELVDLSRNGYDVKMKLLTQVYKTGKTLSVVYEQAQNCSIDSFVVFVPFRREGGLSRPKVIEDGIRAWLTPYVDGGVVDFENEAPLNLYVNSSLFGEVAAELADQCRPGREAGLQSYVDLRLDFANERCVDYFFTSNVFRRCELSLQQQAAIEDNEVFAGKYLNDSCGLNSLKAMFNDGMGADYMFQKLANEIDVTKRHQLYDQILERDLQVLTAAVAFARPQAMDETEQEQCRVLREVLDSLQSVMADGREMVERSQVVPLVKKICYLDDNILEPLPTHPRRQPQSVLQDYITRQVNKWIGERCAVLASDPTLSRFMLNPQVDLPLFLESLATLPEEDGVNPYEQFSGVFNFVGVADTATEARAPFAMMLSNLFLTGKMLQCEYVEEGDSGIEPSSEEEIAGKRLISTFMDRIQGLINGGLNPNRRPPLDGDDELEQLFSELN